MYAPTRRTFIRQAACAALTTSGLLNTIFDLRRLSAAIIADTGDYKALICLFLYGGNDANNVIVPHDASGYASYAAARGVLSIPQASLLPLTLQTAMVGISAFIPTFRSYRPCLTRGTSGLSRMWARW